MKTEWIPESGEQVFPCYRNGVSMGNSPEKYIGKSTINMDFPYVCENEYGEYDSYAIVKPYDEKFAKLSKIYEKAKLKLILYQKEINWTPKKGEQVFICDEDGNPYETPEVYLGKIANYAGDKTFYLCQTELDDYHIYTYAEIRQYDEKFMKLVQAEKKAKKEFELYKKIKKSKRINNEEILV